MPIRTKYGVPFMKLKYLIYMHIFYLCIYRAACVIVLQTADKELHLVISSDYCNPLFYNISTVYPKKYAHGFCFAVLCCGYTLTDFPISIRLTSLALWQSNDCPSASKANLMNMDKYFMWIHYERLHNHNKANNNKTVCIFLGIYCMSIEDSHVLHSPALQQNCKIFNAMVS